MSNNYDDGYDDNDSGYPWGKCPTIRRRITPRLFRPRRSLRKPARIFWKYSGRAIAMCGR